MEQVLHEFRQRILAHRPLQIRGGGSKDWYGQTPQGEELDVRAYAGIVDYEPTELVITARCGTPLAEIEAALAEHRQMLACEPPHFGPGATIGGAVACGLSGPARQASGALRDFVLGVDIMDGAGEILHFGGQVMKNVAGYDVSRLLTGSLGSLGLILQASIKVLPLPFATATRCFQMAQADALRSLNTWGGQPLPISASVWCDDRLTLRLSGAQAAVEAAIRNLGGEPLENADAFWLDLREQRHPYFNGAGAAADTALWRLSVPSVAPPIGLPGATLIEWGGAQRWLRVKNDTAVDNAADIRAAASAAGGHATLFRGGDKQIGVFQPLAPAVEKIHRRLKAGFDPHGVFNPGRLYPGL
ncbi:MAG: glcE [Herbaspirillum sp.]|jgi:glycolate oxidase FAD binding subunit|nr:glcE [Herbaspirillum sp.]